MEEVTLFVRVFCGTQPQLAFPVANQGIMNYHLFPCFPSPKDCDSYALQPGKM